MRYSADGIARPHLPAELADDVDHGRAAVLRELAPYGFIDLFLREDPARAPGQVEKQDTFKSYGTTNGVLPSNYCYYICESARDNCLLVLHGKGASEAIKEVHL